MRDIFVPCQLIKKIKIIEHDYWGFFVTIREKQKLIAKIFFVYFFSTWLILLNNHLKLHFDHSSRSSDLTVFKYTFER